MRNVIIFTILICLKFGAYSQITFGGLPKTFVVNTTNNNLPNFKNISQSINNSVLPNFNNSNLQLEADSITNTQTGNGMELYGKRISTNINIITASTNEIIDSTKVYRYKFSSSTALALQFVFTKFDIPETGELYIYNNSKTHLFGALTKNNLDSATINQIIKVITVPLNGNDFIIEYNEPINSVYNTQLEVGYVTHVFNSKFAGAPPSSSCNRNVNCPEGFLWQIEKKSVALILIQTQNGWAGNCTGTLLNNANNDGKPYLLTAGHCLRDENNNFNSFGHPSGLLFIFNYEDPDCNNTGQSFNFTNSHQGSLNLSGKLSVNQNIPSPSPILDYQLLFLQKAGGTIANLLPFDVCYSGWSNDEFLLPTQKPYTIIHHPKGDVKKITFSDNQIDAEQVDMIPPYVAGAPNSTNKMFYKVTYGLNTGVTEPGSSGSSLFDADHKVRGILSVGPNSICVNGAYNGAPTFFSKFSKAFTDGGFNQWLSNNNNSIQSVGSFCPSTNTNNPSGSFTGRTIDFSVNGQNINGFVNVCSNQITIAPVNNLKWYFHESKQDRACQNITNANEVSFKETYLFDTRCRIKHLQLMVSIVEVDQNKNSIGAESVEWFYIYDNDQSTENEKDNFTSFNLNNFLPQGFQIQDGKFYKIRLATMLSNDDPDLKTGADQFQPRDRFINTYSQSKSINNMIFSANQVGGNITITNSSAPVTLPNSFKIVANNSISLKSTSSFKKGRYYIDSIDCNNVGSFRVNNSDTLRPVSYTKQVLALTNSHTFNNNDVLQSKRNLNVTKKELVVLPNPSSGIFKISLNNIVDKSEISIINFLGQEIYSKSIDNKTEVIINLKDEPIGVYTLVLRNKFEIFTKKLVKE